MYCHVVNNQPLSPQPLPPVWANASNFNALSDAELAGFGWYRFIPSIQPDYNPATHRVVQELQFTGTQVNQAWVIVPLTAAEIAAAQAALVASYDAALKAHYDQMAKRKDYDNFISATTYHSSQVATWAQDCKQISDWRDSCVLKAYDIMSKVQAGLLPLPSIPDFIAMMPPLWPDPNPPATGGGGGNGNGTLS